MSNLPVVSRPDMSNTTALGPDLVHNGPSSGPQGCPGEPVPPSGRLSCGLRGTARLL